jgi:hypothetical protein
MARKHSSTVCCSRKHYSSLNVRPLACLLWPAGSGGPLLTYSIELIRNMLAAGTCKPLVDAVQEGQLQPGLQGRLMELAARAMVLDAGGAAAVVSDRSRGGSLRDLAELTYAPCF